MILSGHSNSISNPKGAGTSSLRILNRRNFERALWFCLCTISLFISLELSAFEHFDSTQGKFDVLKELSTKKEVKQYSLEDSSEESDNFFWTLIASQAVAPVTVILGVLLVCLIELFTFAQRFFAVHSGRSPPRQLHGKFQVTC